MKATVVLFSTLLGLLVSEAGLRLMDLPSTARTHMSCIYQEDAGTGYRYVPYSADWLQRNTEINNYVQINSQGFHDVEHNPAKVTGLKRILVMGDSFTAANHVSVREGWTQILQDELNRSAASAWEVINLGLDGTGTDIQEKLLEQYMDMYQADLVLLAFYTNDMEDLEAKTKYRVCYKGNVLLYQTPEQKQQLMNFVEARQPGVITRWMYEHIYLVRMLAFHLESFSADFSTPYTLLVSNFVSPSRTGHGLIQELKDPKDLKALLLRMKGFVESRHARFIILPVPAKNRPDRSYQDLQGVLSEQERQQFEWLLVFDNLQEVLAKQGLSHGDLYWHYDGHFNALGYQTFGEVVAHQLGEEY